MNTFVRIEEFKTFEKVVFYTIRLIQESADDILEEEYSETDKFFAEFGNSTHDLYDEFATIFALMKKIGSEGAKGFFFNRDEDQAFALPSKPRYPITVQIKPHSTLRLYCVLVNESEVILCGGSQKTANAVQDCPNVLPHFRRANKVAKELGNIDFDLRGGDDFGFYM